jgi:pyruvate/2-oxoglutarate dehydrogenase complex dihydrolipoamide acyltransferase (E2) component
LEVFWYAINQPQVGILALGAIRKMPAVIETLKETLLEFARKCFYLTAMTTE